MKAFTALFCLLLVACGGGGSAPVGSSAKPPVVPGVLCLKNVRNCDDADVDIESGIRWAADNNIPIVHVRWAGCCNDNRYFAISKYAFDRGTIVLWPAGDAEDPADRVSLDFASTDMLVVGGQEITTAKGLVLKTWSHYGPAVDIVMGAGRGTIHFGISATARLAHLYQQTGDMQQAINTYLANTQDWNTRKPNPKWKVSAPIMIIDNGFSPQQAQIMWGNTALAGTTTGDYGIKAVNELKLYIESPVVIGYVPFNTAPTIPRIDGWEIK